MSACTCASCGRRFSGIGAFSMHQTSAPGRPEVVCRDPAELADHKGRPRLVNRNGTWFRPAPDPWALLAAAQRPQELAERPDGTDAAPQGPRRKTAAARSGSLDSGEAGS